jgi:hypothetical protein
MPAGEHLGTDLLRSAWRTRLTRLGGWQRMWVVLTVVWCVISGVLGWLSWPRAPIYASPTTGKPYPPLYLDPETGTPIPNAEALPPEPVPLDELTELLVKYGGVPIPTSDSQPIYVDAIGRKVVGVDAVGNPIYDPRTTNTEQHFGPALNIPNVGSVRFPTTMNQDAVSRLCEQLKIRFGLPHEKRMSELRARRLGWAQIASALWLLPPLALYALGCSVGWVFRGFAANKNRQ